MENDRPKPDESTEPANKTITTAPELPITDETPDAAPELVESPTETETVEEANPDAWVDEWGGDEANQADEAEVDTEVDDPDNQAVPDEAATPEAEAPATATEPEPKAPVAPAEPVPLNIHRFAPPPPPAPKKSGTKKVFTALVVLIIIAALAGGGYLLFGRSQHTPAKTVSTATAPKVTSQAINSITKISTKTQHYDSDNFSIGFDYPDDWVVNDSAATKLTITSPGLQLKGLDGQAFTGEIVLSVQKQQTSLPQFSGDKAVAPLESTKLTYKAPSADQRAQTYLTFVSYTGLTNRLDALYITGDNGYQAEQLVPMGDIVKADPLVSVSFLKCADSACAPASNIGTSLPASDWSDKGLSAPILNLLKSTTVE